MSDLLSGDLEILGRILPASNHTFLATIDTTRVVYKPVTGERPLWDFPHGTLAGREVAAFLVSGLLGWDLVPETVLRDGPFGAGMVQRWCEPDGPAAVDVVARGQVPEGWCHVLDARGAHDEEVSLVHEDSPALRRLAVFDLLTNNTDRKGGHILSMSDGRRLGVDHGICFHVDDKVRSVLWGWAGQRLTEAEQEGVEMFTQVPTDGWGLSDLLEESELVAMSQRAQRLADEGVFPTPTGEWPAIPWPPF